MKGESNLTDFGLFIAYVLPGFMILWGLSHISPTIQLWLQGLAGQGPTVGAFLYAMLGSCGAGLTASTVRWLVLDTLHHATGIDTPAWDFWLLGRNVEAFETLVKIHYSYYQFYGNGLVAIATAYACWRLETGVERPLVWPELLALLMATLFFAGSRDTLRKYYLRTGALLDRKRTGDLGTDESLFQSGSPQKSR